MKQYDEYRLYAILLFATFLALYVAFVLAWGDALSQECTVFADSCYYPMPFPSPPSTTYLPMVVNQ